jgi:hypothetical protein
LEASAGDFLHESADAFLDGSQTEAEPAGNGLVDEANSHRR